MTVYDVFNGDADGICALAQLRNATPLDSQLITGVKRDIDLLKKIDPQPGDEVNVLDVSLDKNRPELQAILDRGIPVLYVDHHFAGDIPESDKLTAIINTDADVCTSILVNGHLRGQFLAWAVVGAYGDNLNKSAGVLAKPLQLNEEQQQLLENLGIYINYNGYGASVEDLHFHPAELFRIVSAYATPFQFIEGAREAFQKLEQGYHDDMASARAVKAEKAAASSAVFILPDEAWSRRVSGVYSNDLANDNPDRAHAVLTSKKNGNYLVSVRAPMNRKTGADELCRQFPTGGGRAAAAGINDLPVDMLQDFIDRFAGFYQQTG